MLSKRPILGAVWLVPLAALLLLSKMQLGAPVAMPSPRLWPIVFAATACLIVVRWNRQWISPNAWGWGALVVSISLASLALYLNDGRLTAFALCVYCFAWARNHIERITDSANPSSLTMMSYLPIMIVLLAVPNSLWNLLEGWHWSWFSTYCWPVIHGLEIPFLISDTKVEFSKVVWSRQAIFGDFFSVYAQVAVSVLWLGFVRRPVLLASVYAAVAVVWAFLTNFIRFIFSAWLMNRFDVDGYQGWLMYLTGIMAMLVSFFLMMATDRLMWVLLFPVVTADSSQEATNPLICFWNRYLSIVSNLPAGSPKS